MAATTPAPGVQSPSKKVFRPAASPVAPDPSDLRGSLRPQTHWDELLRVRPAQSRMAVSRGHLTTTTNASTLNSRSRRPLGPSATEPVLSFAHPSIPSYAGAFKSSRDALDEAYEAIHGPAPHATGKRADELRPMWDTAASSTGSDEVSARARAASLRADDSGFWGGGGGPAAPTQDDGDGFDLDEALGPAKGGLVSFAGFGTAQTSTLDGQQGTGSTAQAAATQRFKRALDDDDNGSAARAEDDEDMVATDVEDEGQEGPTSMSGFGQARRVAGLRKGWGKTQSLPPSAFAGQKEF